MLCTVNFTEELTGRVIQRAVGTNVQKQHIQLKNVKQQLFGNGYNFLDTGVRGRKNMVDPKLVENKDSKFINR